MALKLNIDEELCTACGLCQHVCIRDNIVVEDFAVETETNCFECGHCMAICKAGAITLKSFEGHEDRIIDYNSREIPLDYDDLLQFLRQRRSIRWFKNKKIDKKTFDKIFEGAYYSPSAQNAQDVEFVVLDEKLDEFMKLVYLKKARIPRLLKSRMNRKFRGTFIFTSFLQLFF